MKNEKLKNNIEIMGKKKFDWEEEDEVSELEVFDTNSVQLFAGDSVIAIKDIKVKWASDIKRWDKFKNIRLTDDADLIESWKMVLRVEFFKKG